MSGIFKSVKKVFKKIGKVIKKIAPVLIIAAAVYFGGAYLMASSGAGTAAAGASVTYNAGGVGAAFTKSAGVWKSFLGGLSNGTASSSAVAFAEGSYKASQAGMALSGQVAAGTASVNNLATMGTVGEAVKSGVGMAQSAFSSGSDPQTSWGILFNGLNNVTAPAADAAAATSTFETAFTDGIISDSADVGSGSFGTTNQLGGGSEVLGEEVASTPRFTSPGENLETAPPRLATTAPPAPTDITKVDKPAVTTMQQMMLDMREQALLDRQDYNAQVLAQNAERASIDKMKLGMTGAGLFLNAFGQYSQAKAADEDKKRKLNWKPSGTEYDPYKGLIA